MIRALGVLLVIVGVALWGYWFLALSWSHSYLSQGDLEDAVRAGGTAALVLGVGLVAFFRPARNNGK